MVKVNYGKADNQLERGGGGQSGFGGGANATPLS